MLRRPFLLTALVLLGLGACAAPQPPAPDLGAAQTSLRDTDARYAKATEAREKDAFLAFYATDAVMYPAGGATLTGHSAIGGFVETAFGDANFAISFQPAVVDVSADGSMGSTFATAELTMTGPDGKPVTEKIRDFHVWRRQPDGSWKLTVDIWNVEPEPAAQPATN